MSLEYGKKSEGSVVALELSAVKIQQLNKQPAIETSVKMSEDGRWIISKTTITDIKPVTYFEKGLNNRK